MATNATREPDALWPDRIRKVQWTRLSGGEVPADVLARLFKRWSHRTGVLLPAAAKAVEKTGRPRPFEMPSPAAKSNRMANALAAPAVGALLGGGSWWYRINDPRQFIVSMSFER